LNQVEAQEATATTQVRFQTYLLQQQSINQFEADYKKLQTDYQALDHQLDEEEDWQDTGYFSTISNAMNTVRDLLDKYEDKNPEDIEKIQQSLTDAKEALQNALLFIQKYDALMERIEAIDRENIASEIIKTNTKDVALLSNYSLDQEYYDLPEGNEIQLSHTLEELSEIES
jgi:hypothetical protein